MPRKPAAGARTWVKWSPPSFPFHQASLCCAPAIRTRCGPENSRTAAIAPMPPRRTIPRPRCAATAAHRHVEPKKSVQRSTPRYSLPVHYRFNEVLPGRTGPPCNTVIEAAGPGAPDDWTELFRLDEWSSAVVAFGGYRVAVSSTFNAPVSAALPKTS